MWKSVIGRSPPPVWENILLGGFQFVDETYRQYKGYIGRTQNILLGGFQVFKHSVEETHNKQYKGHIDMLTAQQQFVENMLLIIRFFEQKKVAQYDALVR